MEPGVEEIAVHFVFREPLGVFKEERFELEQFHIQIVHLAFRVDRELQRFKLAGELPVFATFQSSCGDYPTYDRTDQRPDGEARNVEKAVDDFVGLFGSEHAYSAFVSEPAIPTAIVIRFSLNHQETLKADQHW